MGDENSDSDPKREFDSPASKPPARTSTGMKWQPPTPEELHQKLPQYKVLELLGRGGMGAVYKGWQTSLERYVAIKILPPSLGDEDAGYIARFKHEAKTMARLAHPDIIAVHDFGETADGLCYIVMEFIEGADVQQMITEQGKLAPDHALAIAMHVCDALACAHENGIIHRDIKSSNVMVDTQGRVKVADFGLAKATHGGATLLTGTNVALGTPDFIAPEALITGMNVDQRADLYSLGVMLYQMLTGKVPRGMCEKPSVRVPGLDPRFDDAVNRAMREDRDERYQSAQELRAALTTIHTVPLPQFSRQVAATTASSKQPPLRSARTTAPAPPKSRPSFALIGLGAGTVAAVGLFMWKPWSNTGGPPVGVAGISPANQSDGREAGSSTTQGSNSQEGSSSKVQGNVAKPAEKPMTPQVVAATSTTPSPRMTLPASESAAGNQSLVPTAAGSTPHPAPPATTPPGESVLSSAATSTPAKPALPAELATLDAQFRKLQAERVTTWFEEEVAKLNTGYSGGLEREMAKEKAAGDLDAVLALEAEKKLVSDKQPVPSLEDETASDKSTPDALKKLRAIYRDAYTKLESQRTANLKAITDPLAVRLLALESDLTKKDRIADAKVVREYRESLASTLPEAGSAEPAPPTGAAPKTKPITPTVDAGALKDGFMNTLGMKFMHVTGTKVLFCIHTTRQQDYAAYAAETPGVNGEWKTQKRDGIAISLGDDYPVVGVSWGDANAFCAWLSKKEGRTYRLPTDREWSIAVGIGLNEKVTKDTTPESLTMKVPNVFPWGNQWPPPKGAGNYADTSCKEKFPAQETIAGYTDGYPTTSPVMSFKPNKLGLFDMGGNVWQWCEDWFDVAKTKRALRGGSWNYYERNFLLSSCRALIPPDTRSNRNGFRCAVALGSDVSSADTASPGANAPTANKVGQSVGVDSSITIPANSPNGHRIGKVKRGDLITLTYVSGKWKDHGGIATENPDLPGKDDKNRLVIASAADKDLPGALIKMVPAGTATKPFTYLVQTDREDIVLRINSNSDRKENPGSVTYDLKITRQ